MVWLAYPSRSCCHCHGRRLEAYVCRLKEWLTRRHRQLRGAPLRSVFDLGRSAKMKTLLRRDVPFFVVLCVGALAADLALRLSLRRNRIERETYFESVVGPTEEKAREDWQRQRAAIESDVAKQSGAIAPLPKIDVRGIDASLRMSAIYDEPY